MGRPSCRFSKSRSFPFSGSTLSSRPECAVSDSRSPSSPLRRPSSFLPSGHVQKYLQRASPTPWRLHHVVTAQHGFSRHGTAFHPAHIRQNRRGSLGRASDVFWKYPYCSPCASFQKRGSARQLPGGAFSGEPLWAPGDFPFLPEKLTNDRDHRTANVVSTFHLPGRVRTHTWGHLFPQRTF